MLPTILTFIFDVKVITLIVLVFTLIKTFFKYIFFFFPLFFFFKYSFLKIIAKKLIWPLN